MLNRAQKREKTLDIKTFLDIKVTTSESHHLCNGTENIKYTATLFQGRRVFICHYTIQDYTMKCSCSPVHATTTKSNIQLQSVVHKAQSSEFDWRLSSWHSPWICM